MTTLELVDALEAGIAALRSHNGNSLPRESNPISPSALVAEMQAHGVSVSDLAAATGVKHADVESWLNGAAPVPSWIPAIIRVTALLPLPARRRLQTQTRTLERRQAERTHPFSRIEEL